MGTKQSHLLSGTAGRVGGSSPSGRSGSNAGEPATTPCNPHVRYRAQEALTHPLAFRPEASCLRPARPMFD